MSDKVTVRRVANGTWTWTRTRDGQAVRQGAGSYDELAALRAAENANADVDVSDFFVLRTPQDYINHANSSTDSGGNQS